MTRTGKLLAGLILAGMAAGGLPARGDEAIKPQGTGPAYEQVGKVAVMHAGASQAAGHGGSRGSQAGLQPRDDHASRSSRRGREAPRSRGLQQAGWDGLVGREMGSRECLPRLDRPARVLGRSAVHPRRLPPAPPAHRGRTARGSTQGDRRQARHVGRGQERIGEAGRQRRPRRRDIDGIRPLSKLPVEDRRAIAELAVKLTEEHKWLTPHELDEATVTVKGVASPFMRWAREMSEQQRKFHDNPLSVERPAEIEKRHPWMLPSG